MHAPLHTQNFQEDTRDCCEEVPLPKGWGDFCWGQQHIIPPEHAHSLSITLILFTHPRGTEKERERQAGEISADTTAFIPHLHHLSPLHSVQHPPTPPCMPALCSDPLPSSVCACYLINQWQEHTHTHRGKNHYGPESHSIQGQQTPLREAMAKVYNNRVRVIREALPFWKKYWEEMEKGGGEQRVWGGGVEKESDCRFELYDSLRGWIWSEEKEK